MIDIINKTIRSKTFIIFSLLVITLNIMRVYTINGIPFNIAVSDLLVPIVFIVILKRMYSKRTLKENAMYLPIFIVLMTWVILTNLYAYTNTDIVNISLSTTIGEWIKTGLSIIYFYIGLNILEKISAKDFLRLYGLGYSIFLVVGFTVLYAINQGIAIGILSEYIQDNNASFFLGTYHDPNHAATYIMVSSVLLIYGVLHENSRNWKVFYIILFTMSFPAILLSDSRGGLISFIVAISVYTLFTYRKYIAKMISAVFLFIMLSFFSLMVDSFAYNGIYLGKLVNSFIAFDTGMSIRTSLTKVALLMARDHWLLGVGRGNFILNSAPYFESLGLERINNIPHNTYVGLIAETGIVGFILYSTPIILIILNLYKLIKKDISWLQKYHSFLVALIAAGSGLALQAAILNIENRRTYWLLAGVIIYSLLKNKIPADNIKKVYVRSYNPLYLNFLLGIICLGILLFTSDKVYFQNDYIHQGEEKVIELPITNDLIDKKIELVFDIETYEQTNNDNQIINVQIIEKLNTGKENVLFEFVYPQSKGQGKITFTKEYEDSIIIFKHNKLEDNASNYLLTLKQLIYENKTVYLNREYYLLGKNIVDNPEFYFDKWAFFDLEKYEKKNYYSEVQLSNAVFGEMISLDHVHTYQENDNTYIELTYTCLENIQEDYRVQLYGIPDNIHVLDIDQFSSGKEYYVLDKNILTSTWIQGEEYTVSFVFDRESGWFNLYNRFYYRKSNDKTVWLRLVDNRTQLDLGWINSNRSYEFDPIK